MNQDTNLLWFLLWMRGLFLLVLFIVVMAVYSSAIADDDLEVVVAEYMQASEGFR